MGKTILFLCSEVMPYTSALFETLIKNYEVNIVVIEDKNSKLTPYIPSFSENMYFAYLQDFEKQRISFLDFCISKKPDLCYIAGWKNKKYLKIAKYFKENNLPVVSGLDNPWQNTLKQKIAVILSFYFVKPFFTHLWVAGKRQHRFASYLGYNSENIIPNLYSADTELFNNDFGLKKSKNILFVGRFTQIKGIDLLVKAFNNISKKIKDETWTLTLVGNGDIINTYSNSRIIIKSFLNSDELKIEAHNSSIFCLPSLYEPWGVVIHEFASMGLALLTSNICGANEEFLINGYNGFTFKSNDLIDLENKIERLMLLDSKILNQMGKNSKELSKRITIQTSAANLISIIN